MKLKVNEIADALYSNAQAQEKVSLMLKPLKIEEENLREEMMSALKKNKLTSFKSDVTGSAYTRAYRASLEVVDGEKALKWALKNDSVKIDTTKANKLLKGAGALPEGFEQKETEYLTISKSKDE